MGHLGIQRGNPDEAAIEMMNDLLGGSGFTSRITARVRADEGLAYDAGSSFGVGVYYPGSLQRRVPVEDGAAAPARRRSWWRRSSACAPAATSRR